MDNLSSSSCREWSVTLIWAATPLLNELYHIISGMLTGSGHIKEIGSEIGFSIRNLIMVRSV